MHLINLGKYLLVTSYLLFNTFYFFSEFQPESKEFLATYTSSVLLEETKFRMACSAVTFNYLDAIQWKATQIEGQPEKLPCD